MASEFDGVVTAWDDLELDRVTALISRKAVAGDRQMLAQVYLKRGALVPLHARDGEELIYVLEGMLRLRVAGEDVVVREGEVVRVPGLVPRQIEALSDTFALTARGEVPRRPAPGGRRPEARAPA